MTPPWRLERKTDEARTLALTQFKQSRSPLRCRIPGTRDGYLNDFNPSQNLPECLKPWPRQRPVPRWWPDLLSFWWTCPSRSAATGFWIFRWFRPQLRLLALHQHPVSSHVLTLEPRKDLLVLDLGLLFWYRWRNFNKLNLISQSRTLKLVIANSMLESVYNISTLTVTTIGKIRTSLLPALPVVIPATHYDVLKSLNATFKDCTPAETARATRSFPWTTWCKSAKSPNVTCLAPEAPCITVADSMRSQYTQQVRALYNHLGSTELSKASRWWPFVGIV